VRKLNSTYNINSSFNSDSTKDSSYNSLFNNKSNSESNADIKAIDIKRIIQEFKEEEVMLFNSYNKTKAIIEVELEK
jgi:hypothetical protein